MIKKFFKILYEISQTLSPFYGPVLAMEIQIKVLELQLEAK